MSGSRTYFYLSSTSLYLLSCVHSDGDEVPSGDVLATVLEAMPSSVPLYAGHMHPSGDVVLVEFGLMTQPPCDLDNSEYFTHSLSDSWDLTEKDVIKNFYQQKMKKHKGGSVKPIPTVAAMP